MNITQIKKSLNGTLKELCKSPLGGFRGLLLALPLLFNACADWIDVVPEGVATLDMAFNSREQTLKYLGTCYSYMPKNGSAGTDPAILGCDETWTVDAATMDKTSFFYFSSSGLSIARGMQNATNPLLDSWGTMYQALRDCNVFLENVGLVPDVGEYERERWIAEVKVLKAWYHFLLVQRYGPIPLVRENIAVSDDVNKVKVVRDPVDDCFQYIVKLLDEAIANEFLPSEIVSVATELGRITKPIAMAVKAKILVTAASPLFNGNEQLATLKNPDGTQLFNTTYDNAKWQRAALACKEAIDACHAENMALYEYPNTVFNKLNDTLATQMSLRNLMTERWNSEIIWANTQSLCTGTRWSGMQTYATPKWNGAVTGYFSEKFLSHPLKIVNMFYTRNGVPLEEDKTRNVNTLYNIRIATADERFHIKTGDHNIELNFDREPRFYAWLGFDGGIWFGQGRSNENQELWSLQTRNGGIDQVSGYGSGATGYIPKKHIPYTNVASGSGDLSTTPYPWPIIRLGDLYLLYAEALNEAEGADRAEMFKYIDLVRKRAGLKGVKDSWDQFTLSPKYSSPEGMRDIIRQERMIELFFEGHRFWDIRRWKTAPELCNATIDGYNVVESADDSYYEIILKFTQKFGIRDYFWPIKNSDILNNRNLVQNIGW